MKLIGLTGGIASGKSTVAQLLRERGFVVLSADQIAREVVEPGQPAYQNIVETFGDEVLQPNGQLDRTRLGALVFSDPEKRAQLNAITHPRIAWRAAEQIAQHRDAGTDVLVYEVPLLFETQSPDIYDCIIVVTLSPTLQQRRLLQRDQLSPEAAQQRIASQMPLADKEKRADHVIHNNGSLDDLRRAVDVIIPLITPSGHDSPPSHA